MALQCLNNISNNIDLAKLLNQLILTSRSINNTFVIIDIDNLSYFNLKYGFEAGDILLEKVCQKIKQHIDQAKFIGRLGSDEFLIVVESTNESTKKFVELLMIFEEELKITVSMGLINLKVMPQPETLIKSLQSAVQKAKSNGKNKIFII